MVKSFSKFHKLNSCDGLEALTTRHYNSAFPFHFHQTYNISLVYDGSFRTNVQDKNLLAPSGTILITNPLEIHSNPCESHERVSFFTFYISPGFFSYSAKNKPAFFQQNIIDDKTLFNALHKIALQVENENVTDKTEWELSRALNRLATKYAFADQERTSQLHHQSLFRDLLASEDFDKFSLDQTAKQFGINKYKFLRLFKFQTGLTPNNYFIFKRIEKSKELLFAGEDLLSVAIDLGFYDIPHFAKHFKKFTGISPAAYSTAVTSLEKTDQ